MTNNYLVLVSNMMGNLLQDCRLTFDYVQRGNLIKRDVLGVDYSCWMDP